MAFFPPSPAMLLLPVLILLSTLPSVLSAPPTPSHLFSFLSCSSTSPITSLTSTATGAFVNNPTCSSDGVTFDGIDDYIDLQPYEFGGDLSIEIYLKFTHLETNDYDVGKRFKVCVCVCVCVCVW